MSSPPPIVPQLDEDLFPRIYLKPGEVETTFTTQWPMSDVALRTYGSNNPPLIYANKLVLSMHSRHFAQLFYHPNGMKRQGVEEVTLDVHFYEMIGILKFIHHYDNINLDDELTQSLDYNSVVGLYKASIKLKIPLTIFMSEQILKKLRPAHTFMALHALGMETRKIEAWKKMKKKDIFVVLKERPDNLYFTPSDLVKILKVIMGDEFVTKVCPNPECRQIIGYGTEVDDYCCEICKTVLD